ncbi:MAG: hypothetical protein NT139_00705 [Candidatus Woesearchaeota archaeon]|nr:hypothetical protein [Candidatus Woesearchaeota archaeon]
MVYRVFNTIEEAIETWREDEEKAFKRRAKSGILCECHCYRRKDDIRHASPIRQCLLLIPEETYNGYKKDTDKRYKDVSYEFPHVAVLAPGYIRVRKYGDKNDYGTEQNLCKYQYVVEELLKRYIGQKIRLGKNISVKKKNENI